MARRNASNRGARDYSDVPVPRIQRSVFDRSHSVHTAFNAGDLVPVDREELLPGDTIRIQPNVFARLTTLEVPVFSNVFIDVHYFAVPKRLIWDNAEEFFGAEPGGPNTRVDRLTPKLDLSGVGGVAEESLHDYIGVIPGVQETRSEHMPHNFYGRAYNLIFNEYYRDAELQTVRVVDKDDGPDDPDDYVIQRRNKQRDRFTSARPWPYKGPDVNINIGSSAPLVGSPGIDNYNSTILWDTSNSSTLNDPLDVSDGGTVTMNPAPGGGNGGFLRFGATDTGMGFEVDLTRGFNGGAAPYADLSNAVGATVNDLRNTIALQHIFEMFSRAGSARYVELLDTVYGVKSPDARQQRPEFLGGMTTRIMVNPVSATNYLAGQVDLGDLGAYAVGIKSGRGFSYSSTEHQVVLGIASVRTEYLYSQGMDKDLMRHTRFDYHWPAFEGLGEQVIEKGELVWQGTSDDQTVFGYEPRFQEYRERQNLVTGKMRPNAAGTLAYFHLGQDLANTVALNEDFIKEDAPFDRITTLTAAQEPNFKFDMYVDQRHARPVSAAGVPGLRRL